jgi:hypothetical protein
MRHEAQMNSFWSLVEKDPLLPIINILYNYTSFSKSNSTKRNLELEATQCNKKLQREIIVGFATTGFRKTSPKVALLVT